jgi:catechol 2,3-dioxygenase-like lactoylglutathione lyase family enzyme
MSKVERPRHNGQRHLALKVRDLDAMKRFYVDLLGFSVDWEPDADNVYLTSGTDNLALHRVLPPRHVGGGFPHPWITWDSPSRWRRRDRGPLSFKTEA